MLRIRYTRTELSEGIVEDLDADKFIVHEDNTLELRKINPETGKYRVVGMVHPARWESVMLVEEPAS
jgi:hypothetical protein